MLRVSLFATATVLVVTGCNTITSFYTPQKTVEEGGFPKKDIGAFHPFHGKSQEQAEAMLLGEYWNGDRWLKRTLTLRKDKTFVYKQSGIKYPEMSLVPYRGLSRQRYSALAANYSWELEGDWLLGSSDQYMLRLEINRSDLKDTGTILVPAAFLEFDIRPDRLVELVSQIKDEEGEEASIPLIVVLVPSDHDVPDPSTVMPIPQYEKSRWVDEARTVSGRWLIPVAVKAAYSN